MKSFSFSDVIVIKSPPTVLHSVLASVQDNTSLEIVSDTLQIKGLDNAISEGDLVFGANGGNQFTTLAIGTYDSTNSVGQVLQVGANGTVTWSNTLDGGTF